MCLGLCLRWGCIPPPFFQFKDAALKAELLSAASLDNSAVFQLSSDFETDSVEVQYGMIFSQTALASWQVGGFISQCSTSINVYLLITVKH